MLSVVCHDRSIRVWSSPRREGFRITGRGVWCQQNESPQEQPPDAAGLSNTNPLRSSDST